MRRLLAFLARHPWSIGLSLLSTFCFSELAEEVREDELGAFDAPVMAVVARARGGLDSVMLALTHLGDARSMTLIAVAVVVACLVRRRWHAAAFMAVAPGGAALLNLGLKLLFHRARPDASLLYLIETPSSFSFPSGHAMGSAGVLSSVVVLLYALGLPRPYRTIAVGLVVVTGIGIALSRVYFGVHYPSDVLGGQLGALAWVSAVTGWFYPRLLPGERTAPQ
jgi:membrane-associated phospholipid phosphatase